MNKLTRSQKNVIDMLSGAINHVVNEKFDYCEIVLSVIVDSIESHKTAHHNDLVIQRVLGETMTDAENTKRESIPLTPEQWAALERIAAETNSTADRGPTTGQPSWRALLRRIADGELTVTLKDTR